MAAYPGKDHLVTVSSGVITTDGAGDGTGTIKAGFGEIMAVHVDLGTTTSIDVDLVSDSAATILSINSVVADAYYTIRSPAVINDGATAITNSFVPYINRGGDMTVTVANGGDTKTVTVNVVMKV